MNRPCQTQDNFLEEKRQKVILSVGKHQLTFKRKSTILPIARHSVTQDIVSNHT